MNKLPAILLLLVISGQPLAAIDPVYEGSNGIRSRVLSVCMQCHSTAVTGAGRRQAPVEVNFDTYADAAMWSDRLIARAAVEGSMPPQGVQPLTQEQKSALFAWQRAGFPEQSSAATPVLSQPDCLFNWAETSFPELFAPPTKSLTLTPYYYRFYAPSTYLAITANSLLYLGPLSAGTVINLGEVTTWYARAVCK